MVVKKGIAKKVYTWSDGTVEDAVSETTIATVIEKTEGNYIEVLFRKDSHEMCEYGVLASCEYVEEFTVYHGKTIEQILLLNGMAGYTWENEIAQIS